MISSLSPCRTVDCLGILTGAQLFSLNKEELRAVCGDEGNRVFSQVKLQKDQVEVSHTPRGTRNRCTLSRCFVWVRFRL